MRRSFILGVWAVGDDGFAFVNRNAISPHYITAHYDQFPPYPLDDSVESVGEERAMLIDEPHEIRETDANGIGWVTTRPLGMAVPLTAGVVEAVRQPPPPPFKPRLIGNRQGAAGRDRSSQERSPRHLTYSASYEPLVAPDPPTGIPSLAEIAVVEVGSILANERAIALAGSWIETPSTLRIVARHSDTPSVTQSVAVELVADEPASETAQRLMASLSR